MSSIRETPAATDTTGAAPPTTMSMHVVLGRQVVAADTAQEIGEIKAFVVDRSGRAITKVHVAGRKKKARLLPWSSLTVGPDVVMASSAADSTGVAADRDLEAVKGHIDIVGARILDTDGFEHGTVTDVDFDPTNGLIVLVHGNRLAIGADRVRSLGRYAIVVDLSELE